MTANERDSGVDVHGCKEAILFLSHILCLVSRPMGFCILNYLIPHLPLIDILDSILKLQFQSVHKDINFRRDHSTRLQ